jgi:hypothetical protein
MECLQIQEKLSSWSLEVLIRQETRLNLGDSIVEDPVVVLILMFSSYMIHSKLMNFSGPPIPHYRNRFLNLVLNQKGTSSVF